VTSVTEPEHGTAVVNEDNTVTYTPNANYNGSDSFQYTIEDGSGGTATATVTVIVHPVNDAPVANPDDAATTIENPVLIHVLDNDTDVDGDALMVTSVGASANGVATIVNGGQAVVFTPSDNFAGITTFTYTISDGSLTSTATVTVTVYPYSFGGLKPPVGGSGTHEFEQGSNAKVSFTLKDQDGNVVTGAVVRLWVQQVDESNNPIGDVQEPTSSGASNDGNYFRYSASANLYQYNLDTTGMALGKWALFVYLIDESVDPAEMILLEDAPIDGISATIVIK
jgi:hypothetical protein